VTQAFRRIERLLVHIGKTNYSMVFTVIDTKNYDVLLGFNFLIKIGTIMEQPNHLEKSIGQVIFEFSHLNIVNKMEQMELVDDLKSWERKLE
jgi:hypothetical protein